MDNLAQKFLETHSERTAVDLVRLARCSNFHSLGAVLAKFMEKEFPNNIDIKEEYAIMLFYSDKHDLAYFTCDRFLAMRGLTEKQAECALFNQHFSIDAVKTRYIYYDPMRMRQVLHQKKRKFPLVTITITSCKRLDLFMQTINSFVNCCKDIELIDEWFCVDDNSSEKDRNEMRALYPFINFYFKTQAEKGHPQSMNIIKEHVKTPYIFHMEDDWRFFNCRRYITECLEVLGQDEKIGQCLINKNYAETGNDNIKGGFFKTTPSGLRYYIHEYCPTQPELEKFREKYGNCSHCSYWPHFSFRPSLLRTSILRELGQFNETVSHFEMEYSHRYIQKGYISAFLESIYCMHTGRLTSERDDSTKDNAYTLNNEAQFYGKEKKSEKEEKNEIFNFYMKTFVVNLDRRPDRWETFQRHDEPKFLNYKRFSAIDGTKLESTSQLSQIFDNNDYNMRKGMVGCAMSHIKLYIELLKDNEADGYCILEDDIEFVPDFKDKLIFCIQELEKTNWDMFYLGHHLWKQFIDDEVFSKTLWPKIEQFDRFESLRRSIGGTIGYIINKKGAENLLNFINKTGMTNGIDTVQQKSADELNVYYAYPHLVYSECYRGDNNPDTDIQYNYDSLTMTLEDRLTEELKHYPNGILNIPEQTLPPFSSPPTPFYWKCNDKVKLTEIAKKYNLPYYTLDSQILFVTSNENERYIHRFKKNGEWNVDDAIQYKN